MKKLSWIFVLSVTGWISRPALAAEPVIVVVTPQHNLPGDPGRVLGRIVESVGSALDESGYALVATDQARTCAAGEGGATDASRLQGAAGNCAAQAAAGMQVDASAMGYNMRLVIVAADGTVVAEQETTCDFCTEEEMVGKWKELVRGTGGPTPALVAAADGGQGTEPVEPVEPVEPIGPEPGDEEPGPSISDVPWWFWAGGAVSLALIGGGAPLIAIDGDPTCDGPAETCPEVYNTDAAGIAMVVLGVAGLAGVGIGLYFVLSDDETPEEAAGTPEPELALIPAPGGLVLRGVFGP